MKIEVHVHHHCDDDMSRLLRDIQSQLTGLSSQGKLIMGLLEDATAAIAKIDAATTKQGEQLAVIATASQETSDDLDTIIAQIGNQISPEVVAQLQGIADRSEAISNNLDLQSTFSKALAAKYPAQPPVPTPVPEPSPEVVQGRRHNR